MGGAEQSEMKRQLARIAQSLESIVVLMEQMTPASSYAFMVSKAPEFMEQVFKTAEQFKKRRTSSMEPVRKRIMARRRAAVRRVRKD